MSVLNEIYKDEKYYKACKKIAGHDADDLYQFINLKIYELEQAGKFKPKNTYSLYYTMAKREYFSKTDKFAKTHRQRIETTSFETTSSGFDCERLEYRKEETTQTTNDILFTELDAFAKTPSKTESETMVKQVYIEITKPDFKGITHLANKTGISKFTLYGALYRFRELYNDHINTI